MTLLHLVQIGRPVPVSPSPSRWPKRANFSKPRAVHLPAPIPPPGAAWLGQRAATF